MSPELLDACRAQDHKFQRLGLRIHIGAEPTFTRRESSDPWWMFQAGGGDKAAYAIALARALAPRLGGAPRLFRMEGRQYPREDHPRFAYAVQWSEDAPREPWVDAGLEGDPQPPPAIASGESLLTITPDPGVVEVNMAPASHMEQFARWMDSICAAAAEAGLSPLRYRYNGDVTESGGGGQVTFGGPSPEESPFFRHPHALPGLIRYLNHHPSLSYWFAPECAGSASQGPRPDEGVVERLEELQLALDRLQPAAEASPELLWGSLAPLLVDCSGNSHRAEVNIEKLWNPYFGARGRLGLVELRSFRMEPTAERAAAVALMLRAIMGRLCAAPYREPLIDFGRDLHHRFALPHFLRGDLNDVLADLDAHGFGVGETAKALLLQPREPVCELRHGDARMILTPAAEFWPLLGDVASQEFSGARLVDSSTARLEVMLICPPYEPPGSVTAMGRALPMEELPSPGGWRRLIMGIRRRIFVPNPGLHPGLQAQDPLEIRWERNGKSLIAELHSWIPGGGVYDGLPADAEEALRRRRERVILREEAGYGRSMGTWPRQHRLAVDLRRMQAM